MVPAVRLDAGLGSSGVGRWAGWLRFRGRCAVTIRMVEDSPQQARPAVVDGQVVRLPTLAGLARGERGSAGTGPNHLWNALAAAVLAEEAIAELEATNCSFDAAIADVIEMDAYRDAIARKVRRLD